MLAKHLAVELGDKKLKIYVAIFDAIFLWLILQTRSWNGSFTLPGYATDSVAFLNKAFVYSLVMIKYNPL